MNLDAPRPNLPSSPTSASRSVGRDAGRVARLVRLLSRLMRVPMLAVVSEDRIVHRGVDALKARDLVGLAAVMAEDRVVSITNPRTLSRLARNALVRDGVRFVAGLSSRGANGPLVSLLVLDGRLRGPLSEVERALLEEFMPLVVDALETEAQQARRLEFQAEARVARADTPESPVSVLEATGVVFDGLRWTGARLEGRFSLVEPKRATDVSDALLRADLSLLEVDLGGTITGFLGRPRAALGLDAETVGRSVFEVCAEWPGLTLALNRAIEGEQVTGLLRTDPRLGLRAVPARQNGGIDGLIVGAVVVLQTVPDDSNHLHHVQHGTDLPDADLPDATFKPALVGGDGSYASRLRAALISAETALEEAQAEAVELERLRIARELHDGLGKDLFGVAMLLESVAERQRGRAVQTELQTYADLVRRLGNEGRALLESIRQPATPSLASHLHALASSLESAGRVQVQLEVPDDLPTLNPHALHELSRVLEEALENIHRHAHARHAWLIVRPGETWLELSIEDDGRGLPEVMPAGRFGLVGMRERVELLGGHLRVGRGARGGVRLEARLPMAALVEVPDGTIP